MHSWSFFYVNFGISSLCQLTHFDCFTKQISEASRSNPEGISEASAMQLEKRDEAAEDEDLGCYEE